MSNSYFLVANPTAQSGRARERIADARQGLENMGRSVTLLATEPERRTVAAVTKAINSGAHDVAIAMGGDGTFSEVACGPQRVHAALGDAVANPLTTVLCGTDPR